jgi:hypothetical protein
MALEKAMAPELTGNLSDTTTWLPLDGLARGFDANKAEPCHELAGHNVALTRRDGSRLALAFDGDRVGWDRDGESGEDRYEAFAVDDGLYYAQWHLSSRPEQALSLFLDTHRNRALVVTATIGAPGPGQTAVRQEFMPATVDGAEATGAEPAPSRSLIGKRAMWVYSTEHAYEHVYLSPHWYTWQCLAGPERGLADTDENSVYELRPGIYVFAWREKVIPCGSVTVADHRDTTALRSHGYLFGMDETGTHPVHFTFGAYGRLLSVTVHPDEYSPDRA